MRWPGFNRKIPVGHVEAGLRSGNLMSPFPEEMNRRVVSQIASFHFAATEKNRRNLLAEDVPREKIFVTGNPVVDALRHMLKNLSVCPKMADLIKSTEGKKRLLLTTHRRESFGEAMTRQSQGAARFCRKAKERVLFFPVHPNPNVKAVAKEILGKHATAYICSIRWITLTFWRLMESSWLIVSDSGGVQEEAPSSRQAVAVTP